MPLDQLGIIEPATRKVRERLRCLFQPLVVVADGLVHQRMVARIEVNRRRQEPTTACAGRR